MSAQKPLTTALADFAAAFELVSINPDQLEVSLSPDDWKHLAWVLDHERDDEPEPPRHVGQVRIGGVRYVMRHEA